MIRFEDLSVEQAALSNEAYIAIPFEIYQSAAGKVSLTVYRSCKNVAEQFLSAYGGNPFEEEGITWASQRIAAFLADYGYQYDSQASRAILEFTAFAGTLKKRRKNEAVALKTRDAWLKYENQTDAEPDFGNAEKGTAYAVIRDDKIISCACTNDAFYANGAAEIHVETALQYRGQGFGFMCTEALTESLCTQGYKVWYKCYEDNSASVALAHKCGMQFTGKRISFVCYADV